MLFDLRGAGRRTTVKAVYLTLAVLMGGGLVLFGIGGDVSGGLLNAFESDGGTSGNSQLDDRIERQEKRLAASPGNEAVLAELVRLNFQAASAQTPSGSTVTPDEAKDELRRAAAY